MHHRAAQIAYTGAVFRIVSSQSFPYLVLVCILISQLRWIPVASFPSFSPSPRRGPSLSMCWARKSTRKHPIRTQCSHCYTILKHQQETSYSSLAWGNQLQLFGLSIPYLSTMWRDVICMTVTAQIENISENIYDYNNKRRKEIRAKLYKSKDFICY